MLISSAIRSRTSAVGVGFLLNSISRVVSWSWVARCLFWFFCCWVRVLFRGGLRAEFGPESLLSLGSVLIGVAPEAGDSDGLGAEGEIESGPTATACGSILTDMAEKVGVDSRQNCPGWQLLGRLISCFKNQSVEVSLGMFAISIKPQTSGVLGSAIVLI